MIEHAVSNLPVHRVSTMDWEVSISGVSCQLESIFYDFLAVGVLIWMVLFPYGLLLFPIALLELL